MSYATEKWLRARLNKAMALLREAEGMFEECAGDKRFALDQQLKEFEQKLKELKDDGL